MGEKVERERDVDGSAYIMSFEEGGSRGDVGSPSTFGPSGANTPATGAGTPRATTPAPSASTPAKKAAEPTDKTE